ncbi:MAG: hypothetical protein J7623_31020 [Chitinophaga sp.]|uniref:HD domain-containing protein n=1 Tax=Chitinophaga sp. TaxID=1869181 RepID=UPI001B256912|nr:hypothetical protein [Chitinophaga sp.]MBO9733114.1 hypothetical protein [Chitinophaga sp.]
MLHDKWIQLHASHNEDPSLVTYQYEYLTMMYSGEQRTYHNLSHITQMILLWEEFVAHLQDPEVVLWAIFFHDLVYNPLMKNNEADSAEAAERYLQKIGYPENKITLVSEFIVATKTHINTLNNKDLDYFLDFDLQILGTALEAYKTYSRQIRQEYSIYPDLLYKPGRKKLLKHFLEAPAIYHTPVFRELYEAQARENIQTEINTL